MRREMGADVSHATTGSLNVNDSPRSSRWAWTLCVVLLASTLLNYANRSAFTQNAVPVSKELALDPKAYGEIESWFSIGFACGGLAFGILADVISVRWLFPAVVVLWSLAGAATGFAKTAEQLAWCRLLLALFEAGHWPCALRTSQRTFRPAVRTMANSLLQSGASIGAILTPQLVALIYAIDPAQWRWSLYIVAGLAIPWAFAWLSMVRDADVRRPVIQTDESAEGPGQDQLLVEQPLREIFLSRRWWLLLIVVSCINVVWHYVRVWLPLWLETERGYSHQFVQHFTSAYYAATFVGAMLAGGATAKLARRRWNVHASRMAVFLVCALLSAAIIPAAFLPRGTTLLVLLLLVGFGSLGLFPIYYSLNQELSAKHQGKVGGTLGFSTWVVLFFFQRWVGQVLTDQPELKPAIVTVVGLGPLVAWGLLLLFWGKRGA
jgi:ACS family hexuronate transporter-like MFS transporter